jgi:hypothetical protein
MGSYQAERTQQAVQVTHTRLLHKYCFTEVLVSPTKYCS